MTPQIDHIRACSRFLQQPLVAQSVPATPGTLSRAGHANIADTSNIVSLQDKGAYRQKLSRTGEPGAITFHRLP